MQCYGYWFRDLGFYVSGDAADIPDAVLAAFLKGEIKRVYQDTTTKASSAHGYLGRMEEKIPFDERKRYYAVHLPDREAIGLLRAKGFSVASC